jgi:hypothetical protein
MLVKECLRKLKSGFKAGIGVANETFNRLPKQHKKSAVVVFGICVTVISGVLILQASRNEPNKTGFKPDRIAMPYDIFMKDESGTTEDQLTPVGKMKGEIDGEFESFYVAVDNQGAVYINRDIEYSERAYEKTDDWKQISKEKLMEYERDLHFIPSQGKGLRR